MQFQRKSAMILAGSILMVLSGCGGDKNNPYDGTWTVALPLLNKDSTISSTQIVTCQNPGGTVNIKNSQGSTRLSATCTTTLISQDSSGNPVSTTYPPVTTYADIGISIEPKTDIKQQDTMVSLVNGATFTGSCISTVSCSAVNSAGDTISLTR